MTPAILPTVLLWIVILWIVFTPIIGALRTRNKTRKGPGQGRKHNKQWHLEKTAEQATVREAENAYFAGTSWLTPRYALLMEDELHRWIVLRCDHNPYEVAHAWKDCPTCIPTGPPTSATAKAQKRISEKTQGPFAENRSENNGPAKSYKKGGPVSGKTPSVIAGRDLDEIVRADAGEKSQPKWSEILGDELTREALRQHLEKNPDALAAVRPTKKAEYAKTHTFDDLTVENCSAETLHETHTWVPMSGGVAKYRRCPGVQDFVPPTWATAQCRAHDPHKKHNWDRPTADGTARSFCPGVQDFDPKPKEKAGPPRWCRDATTHPEHRWSQDGEDITCLGTFQTFTWMEHERLAGELGGGGGARRPSVARPECRPSGVDGAGGAGYAGDVVCAVSAAGAASGASVDAGLGPVL